MRLALIGIIAAMLAVPSPQTTEFNIDGTTWFNYFQLVNQYQTSCYTSDIFGWGWPLVTQSDYCGGIDSASGRYYSEVVYIATQDIKNNERCNVTIYPSQPWSDTPIRLIIGAFDSGWAIMGDSDFYIFNNVIVNMYANTIVRFKVAGYPNGIRAGMAEMHVQGCVAIAPATPTPGGATVTATPTITPTPPPTLPPWYPSFGVFAAATASTGTAVGGIVFVIMGVIVGLIAVLGLISLFRGLL